MRTFDTSNLRELDSEHSLNIRHMKCSPLILIDAKSKKITYATNRGSKDTIVEHYRENEDTCSLLFAWQGQWSTDVFSLDKGDLDNHYNT